MFSRLILRFDLGATAMALALTLPATVSCQRQVTRPGIQSPPSPSAQHAMHSEKLEAVMADLHHLAVARMPQELDASRDRQRHLREISDLAAAMELSAGDISDILEEVEISEQKAELFASLARSLECQAAQLRKSADQGDVDAVSIQYDGVLATCNACHSAFRILPKLMPPVD